MSEITRILFVSLCRDKHSHHHYYVLNDGNYVSDFYADNDTEAKAIFREEYGR